MDRGALDQLEKNNYLTPEQHRQINAPLNQGAGESFIGYGAKSKSFLTKRGWTWDSAQEVVGNPYTPREAINKATENPATAFYNHMGIM